MFTSYERDQQWFVLHPTMHQYQGLPRPEEWFHVSVPPDAIVTVHYINARCTVRVLAVPHGPRLAEAVDTDPTWTMVSMRRSLDTRVPQPG
jgi:hypothetical protein